MSVNGLRVTPQSHGYGRYFRFQRDDSNGHWIGVNHEKWAQYGDTPLWLGISGKVGEIKVEAIAKELGVRRKGRWIPIHLLTGVEYQEVLDAAALKVESRCPNFGSQSVCRMSSAMLALLIRHRCVCADTRKRQSGSCRQD